VVQGVPGNVRQPAGTEQARRVALDGQGGQRREPEQLAGLHEQGGPAAVGHRKSEVYPAGRGQVRAGQQPGLLAGRAKSTASVASPRTAPASSAAPVLGPSSCRGASVCCRIDRILLIGPPPRLDCAITDHEPYAGLHKYTDPS
jgi:hypothetical protein